MRRDRGFVLLLVLWLVLLLGSIVVMLQLELISGIETANHSDGRLHSRVLADNGIEIGRSLLAAADIPALLKGPDGVAGCQDGAGYRDPLSFDSAAATPISELGISCDDGLAGPEWVTGYESAGGGRIFLRFTNNPEEDGYGDSDGVVILRSMGVVPGRVNSVRRLPVRNQVSMVEARLCQEMPFHLPAGLVLVGSRAEVELTDGRLDGADSTCVGVSGDAGNELLEDVEGSLLGQEGIELTGAGDLIRDVGADLALNPAFTRLRESWIKRRLRVYLRGLIGPGSVGASRPGIRYLPDGGVLSGKQAGLFLTSGDVEVADGTELVGLLAHMGGGALRIGSEVHVRGALWVVNLGESGEGGTLRLEAGSGFQLEYDFEAARSAEAQARPSVLNWRIIFPGM